jgi:UDP-N-acetylmuramyl pentapeptide phosphotransferase/UDP-N-acetylglucosamine-1-phosphate transferase
MTMLFENNVAAGAALLFASGYAAARAMVNSVLAIISNAGFCRKNYLGEKIPAGAGVIFSLAAISVLPVAVFSFYGPVKEKSSLFMLALSFYTLLGLMDDMWGDGRSRGFRGHLKSILAGTPTTGAIKALGGGLAALYLAGLAQGQTGSTALVALNALVLALSVNTLNLLDLRPGRAGKCFLLAAAVIVYLYSARAEIIFIALTAGILAGYLPLDLRGRAMMGDAGANALGAVLGLSVVWLLGPLSKTVYLLVLAAFHLMAEKYSLTGIIASNRMLNYIDMLGRSGK